MPRNALAFSDLADLGLPAVLRTLSVVASPPVAAAVFRDDFLDVMRPHIGWGELFIGQVLYPFNGYGIGPNKIDVG